MATKSEEVEPSTETKSSFQVDGEIHKLIHFIWNKEELHDRRKSPLLYKFERREIKLTIVIIEECSKPSVIRIET
jgi:hypothetical protein